jgi:DNA-binding GntR family transcriptional regulator
MTDTRTPGRALGADGAPMPRAAQLAYSEIRSKIVEGVFPPGSHLEEESIAEAVGVSRTPVREALRRLASEGFVEFVPHQGAFVPAWTTADYHEIFDLRAILESFGARLAARQVSDETLATLEDLTAQMEALAARMTKARMDALANLNNLFHSTVVQASGNRRLLQLAQSAVALPLVLRTFQRYSPERLQRSMQHHREIVDALRARDENWAEAVMKTHILSARWEVAPPGDGTPDGAVSRQSDNGRS